MSNAHRFIAPAMPLVTSLVIYLAISLLWPQTAVHAQNSEFSCRSQLRPLLSQQNPDSRAVAEVANICKAQAADGDADALYQSALLSLGLIEWAPDKAIPMISSAASSGIPEAQYWLAWQYDDGPLLPNDPEQALYWYTAAGESEHRLALARLAEVYANGDLGVTPDKDKAMLLRAQAERCKQKEQT
ncbi:MAG: hypothetical protein OEU86_00940 [Gammaproteobacteria bacterium]|nr:hypothetical protein [Gammaproteobacteria bacterium]